MTIEPLFTVYDDEGRLHIVRVLCAHMESGSYRNSLADAVDVVTGQTIPQVPLEPRFTSSARILKGALARLIANSNSFPIHRRTV